MDYKDLILYLSIVIPGLVASPFVGRLLGAILYQWLESARASLQADGTDKAVIPDSEVIDKGDGFSLHASTLLSADKTGGEIPDKLLQGFQAGNNLRASIEPGHGDSDSDMNKELSKKQIERIKRKILGLQ